MGNHARGYIPPELWDNGITAGLINYNFTGNNAHNTTGGSSRYAYLNLQSGLNIGAWRLRDNSTWSYSSGGSTSSNENRWQHVNSWLERDITPLRSRLTLGGQLHQRRCLRRDQLPRRPAGLRRQYATGQPERLCAGDPRDRPRHGAGVNQAKRLRNLPEHSAAGTIYHRRSLRRGQWRRSAGHDQRSGWLPPGLQRALVNGAGSPA